MNISSSRIKTTISFILGGIIGIAIYSIILAIQQITVIHHTKELNIEGLISSIKESLQNQGKRNQYDRFGEIYDILESKYYSGDMIHSGKMIQRAEKSYVNALGDPYTTYLDNEENEDLNEKLQGSSDFEGIGAYVSKREQGVLVDEVIKDSPASRSDIRPLDIIVQVDEQPTQPLTIGEAVEKIRGPRGTSVKLVLLRTNKKGEQELIEKTVERNTVQILSVTSTIHTGKNEKKIGYIEISSVGEETESLFEKEIRYIKSKDCKAIILDVRGNGGGFLDIAVLIASHFLPKNIPVVSSTYRSYPEEKFLSKGYADLHGLPTVVLVDGLTASAGEIIAMALQEKGNATILGTKTFGKGSIQTIHIFPDKSSLKYTIGNRYSPNGRNIDKEGLQPDIEIPFDQDLYVSGHIDNQLQKALEVLNEKLK